MADTKQATPDECMRIGCGLPAAHLVHNRPSIGEYPIINYHDFVASRSGPDRTPDTVEYWKSRATTAELKVLTFHEEIAKLREEEAPRSDDHEKAMMEVLTERDEAQEWADDLAYAVGEYFDIDVGEHSSCSDPRVEAMKILKGEYVTKFDKPAQEEAPSPATDAQREKLTTVNSRELYIRAKLYTLVPSQIRAVRLKRGLSQKQLADLCGMKQARISEMETAGACNYTIATLARIAAAVGIALQIEFCTFAEMLDWENSYSQDSFDVTPITSCPSCKSPAPAAKYCLINHKHGFDAIPSCKWCDDPFHSAGAPEPQEPPLREVRDCTSPFHPGCKKCEVKTTEPK